jgi:SPP1 gp7 family putative phage head morphogenesis protein
VLSIVSEAIDATAASLSTSLPKLFAQVMGQAGAAVGKQLTKTLKAASASAIRAAKDDIGWAFDKTNPRAVEWIDKHSADLIEGISKSTRDDIKELVEHAFTDGVTADDLAKEIEDVIGDPDRAETIARTETMRASNEGQLEAWDQAEEEGLLTGNERKEWIVTPDDRLCPICDDMDGEIVDMDEEFDVDGDQLDGPPAHPNCRCTLGLVMETP